MNIPYGFAKRFGVLIQQTPEGLQLLAREDVALEGLQEVTRLFPEGKKIITLDAAAFQKALTSQYELQSKEAMESFGDGLDLSRLAEELPITEDLLETHDDAPIIRLINALLTESIKLQASDIHIEPFEERLVVRFRVDGILREVLEPKRALAAAMVSRIKVMAKLDIAEKRVPQDGRISLKVAGHAIDVRVSTIPASHGERVVLRLLNKQAAHLDLLDLGLAQAELNQFNELILRPHGIILVTGPTGSGKTTTLYAALTTLNQPGRNILTVEDPVEYYLEGIGQTQVNLKVSMTFARGLRAILRQDPDVVMVGEIRDLETAEIAVQASLTGHLVLSTLHTNTAIGAFTRLEDMGVEPYLLASSLLGVLAQRLVRVLCPVCKVSILADKPTCELLGVDVNHPPKLYEPKGCDACFNQGYRGRTGIYELVLVDSTLRTMIHDKRNEQQLESYARQHTPSIRQDGFRKVLLGITSLEEVIRVTQQDV